MAASRIDTHHHAVPAFYRTWLAAHSADAGGMPIPRWTPEASKRHLKLTGAATALLSISTPQVTPGNRSDARSIARDLNQYLHELVVAEPATFGYFATLPLPDTEGALDELRTAFDVLAADGVCLLANYGGTYLGDAAFDPVMRELDARGAVAFVHPAGLPGPTVPGLPPYAADFLHDTVRAALNLARSGVLTRYPNITFLLAHAGGYLPFASGRLSIAASPKGNPVDGFRLLRRFYFDTALAGTPYALASLLKFAAKDHVTYGSDFPFAPQAASVASATYQRVTLRTGASVSHEAARKLFPRLVPVVPAVVSGTAPQVEPPR